MRSLFAVWLVALFSLANVSARDSHATEEFSPNQAESLRGAQNESDGQVTFEGYWELVRNTRQAIVEAEAGSADSIRGRLDDLALQWEQVTGVELPDQSVIQVNSSYLMAELRKDPPNLPRLKSLLDSLLEANGKYPQKVFTIQDIDPLKSILARPEFQWAEARTAQMPKWMQNIVDGFFNLIEQIALRVQNLGYYSRIPLILAAALLFAFSLFYISRSLSRSLVREAQIAADGGIENALTSKGAMQRARALSSQGDYRSAIRYLYLSSLLALDQQGLLRYDRSRTNREYLRSVSAKPEVAVPLKDVIDVFDRVWYGFDPVDEETYQSYAKHVDELQEKRE